MLNWENFLYFFCEIIYECFTLALDKSFLVFTSSVIKTYQTKLCEKKNTPKYFEREYFDTSPFATTFRIHTTIAYHFPDIDVSVVHLFQFIFISIVRHDIFRPLLLIIIFEMYFMMSDIHRIHTFIARNIVFHLATLTFQRVGEQLL